jgi:protein-S-isoprenylcysteine O-methyltransferase Ste14
MNNIFLNIIRTTGLLLTIFIWQIAQFADLSQIGFWIIIIGLILLVFPVVWIGRKVIGYKVSIVRLVWITSFIHIILMILFGVSIIEAIRFFQISRGITLPLPVEVGTVLLYFTGACLLLTVINLALSGFGAPFAIVLSKRLADRWMYRWTRNPMVLCTLATLLSAGVYLQSLFFVLWVILLVTPAWIYYLKAFEERELEIRFGVSYLNYKAKTSFLMPRRPKG